jgi:glucose-1-phosphate thymidylyltransferase
MAATFKGILLAGGRGTRLYPLTAIVSKQLCPVYNKPMVYYSLSTLMLSGVREILLISTPEDVPRFEALLGDGSQWGIQLHYAVQPEPGGIAEAFVIGAEFVGEHSVMLMLGDNVIYGRYDFLREALATTGHHATIFAYQVSNPSEYGVVEFDRLGRPKSLEEKPAQPRSRFAIPGMYLYPPDVAQRVKELRPSPRGELEITDLNRKYLELGRLNVRKMGRGIAWLDTGTPRSLLEAANFIEAVESRQDLIIGSPEEVAYRMGYLTREGLARCIAGLPESTYRQFLSRILEEA